METDAPYLAPVPYRGKRNESAYIPLIGQMVADVKHLKIEEVAAITSSNAHKLFKSI
jgi:TatD DNase family protein